MALTESEKVLRLCGQMRIIFEDGIQFVEADPTLTRLRAFLDKLTTANIKAHLAQKIDALIIERSNRILQNQNQNTIDEDEIKPFVEGL